MNLLEAKQKALISLVERIKLSKATVYDLENYEKLKKLGVIR